MWLAGRCRDVCAPGLTFSKQYRSRLAGVRVQILVGIREAEGRLIHGEPVAGSVGGEIEDERPVKVVVLHQVAFDRYIFADAKQA